jgi:hypothetical protein
LVVKVAEAKHVHLLIQIFLRPTRAAPRGHAISLGAIELLKAVEGAAVLKIYYFKCFISTLGTSDVDVTLIRFPLLPSFIIQFYLLFIKE